MVFALIIAFVLHYGITFLMCFSYDKAKIWCEEEFKLHQPKLDDLQEDKSDKYDDYSDEYKALIIKEKRQKYVEKIISPVYHYFETVNEINHYQGDRGEGCLYYLVVQFPTIALMTSTLLRLEFTESLLLCIVIAIIPSLIGDWIISLIYERTPLKIKHFEGDLDSIKSYREYIYDNCKEKNTLEYNISKENYVNYYIIVDHNEYIQSIKQTVILRCAFRKIIGSLGMIVYFIFFWGAGEY